jgi:hypothetical protein
MRERGEGGSRRGRGFERGRWRGERKEIRTQRYM